MAKKIVVTLFLMFELGVLFAQNSSLNHSKYWFYRTRLRNEFMAVGPDQVDQCGTPLGMNIPATSAYEGLNADIHFGDGTSFLGNYMAVLATEYRLMQLGLSPDFQSYETLKKELYWCMKTYERLDKQAEILFAPKLGNCGNDINGFFVRDDVDTNIINKLGTTTYVEIGEDGKKNNVIKKMTTSSYLDVHNAPLSNLDNDAIIPESPIHNNVEFQDDFGKTISGTKAPFPSTDQIANLLVGFAFVRKFMSDVSFDGYDLGEHASYYTSKIMDYYSRTGIDWDLIIPNTPAISYVEHQNASGTASEYGGVQSMVMGYPLAKAGQRVFGNTWGDDPFPSGNWETNIAQLSFDAWNCFNYPNGFNRYLKNYSGIRDEDHPYNNAISSQLAAVGNSWEYGLIPIKKKLFTINVPCTAIYWDNCRSWCLYCYTDFWGDEHCNCRRVCGPRWASWDCGQTADVNLWHYETQLPNCVLDGVPSTLAGTLLNKLAGFLMPSIQSPLPLPKISINTTGLALAQYGNATKTELFSLEHAVLHSPAKMYYGTNALVDYMNTAPCTGPHLKPIHDPHNDSTSFGVVGWQTENRFEKSNASLNTNSGGWNGIDYMLLHNLYYIQHGSLTEQISFKNEMNYSLLNTTISNARTYNGFETLTATNNTIVASGANVQLHAGKWVKMNGGFKASTGSIFKAYTQYTFPCDATTGYKDAEQPPIVEQPTTDTPLDSATVVNEIANGLQLAKDSLSPKVDSVVQAGKYQPLSEFIKIPVQELPILTSQILTVFPNPISKVGQLFTNLTYFLATDYSFLTLSVVDSFGNRTTVHQGTVMPTNRGEHVVVLYDFNISDYPTGIYTLILTGSDFSSQHKIIVP